MLNAVIATKIGMTQAWTTAGKRVAVTRCFVEPLLVLGKQPQIVADQQIIEVGYGDKKIKNMSKPLRTRLEKSGFSIGVKTVRGMAVTPAEDGSVPTAGTTLALAEVLTVGDVVKVQGTTKGRGFAGAVKRHNFKGGPVTHGQSDRLRTVGSIGSGTNPGRVLKGKRMPGHFGDETQTIKGLVVVHVDPITSEVWLSGPIPGAPQSHVTITKVGESRSIELDRQASGIVEVAAPEAVPEAAEAPEAVTTTETTTA